MNCRDRAIEIVELLRTGASLPVELGAHLQVCDGCRDIWESERALQGALARMRAAAAGEPVVQPRRAELLTEYDRIHRSNRFRRVQWAFAVAASVLCVFALSLSRPTVPVGSQLGSDQIAMLTANTASVSSEYDGDLDDGGFVAVPYAPPLADGEFVKVVRTRLYAAALDRMGVAVPVSNGEFPADVVLGEDGLPRAVRLLESSQF